MEPEIIEVVHPLSQHRPQSIVTSIQRLLWPLGKRIDDEIWSKTGQARLDSASRERTPYRSTISTFSCYITYSRSPAASRASARVKV